MQTFLGNVDPLKLVLCCHPKFDVHLLDHDFQLSLFLLSFEIKILSQLQKRGIADFMQKMYQKYLVLRY